MADDHQQREQRARSTAAQAVAAAQRGDDEAVYRLMARYAEDQPGGLADVRLVVSTLLRESGVMAIGLGEAVGTTNGLEVQIHDEQGDQVPIDAAEPPLRTAARALLAYTHGDHQTAETHLEIAFTMASPDQLTAIVLHSVHWTAEFVAQCDRLGVALSDWMVVD
ncbi:hypothetical protein D5S17_11765 [Pseudonocardiaceae bacterium YIM PH 21723]|nr:hypothetical protein D5S17_11765 [Pseudonocardiaceae bacterium YIM PH 21723]